MSIFSDIIKSAHLKVQESIAKASNSIKALQKDQELSNPKSLVNFDNEEEMDSGYRERNSSIGFDILRQMSLKDSIIAAIHMVRVNQIRGFCQKQLNRYSQGFRVVLRNENEKPTPQDQDIIDQLEHFILNTGNTEGRPEKHKRDLSEFLSMITKDLLTYDQVAVELIPTNDNSLAYFIPVSSGSIRFASKKFQINTNDMVIFDVSDDEKIREKINREKNGDRPYDYVQLYKERIVRGFYCDELIFKMMNPTTEIDSLGYSVGPLELLANIVSYHLYAEAHNKLFFVQGFASRGIIHIEGEIPRQQLEAFRKQWREQTSGATNSWRTPIIAGGDKLNWVKLQDNNRDMEWSSWTDYLIKLMCSIYLIAPQEINFDNTKTHGGGLSEGNRDQTIFSDSRFRGLKPILNFYEGIINEGIIKKLDENYYKRYRFEFCGVKSDSQQEELNRQDKEVKIFKTVNEIRIEHDMQPIEDGDIILDTNFLKWKMRDSQNSDSLKEDDNNLILNDGSDIDKNIDNVKKSLNTVNKSTLLKIEYYQ